MSIETRGLLYADNTNNRTVTTSWNILSTPDGFSYPLYLESDYYYQMEAKTDIGTVRINYTAIQFTRNR